jgi:hypothetical protein
VLHGRLSVGGRTALVVDRGVSHLEYETVDGHHPRAMNWVANSETNAHWIAPCLAQIDKALTSVSRQWRRKWRWPAGWLATVFTVDQRGKRHYLTEHSSWSKRATMRWIKDDLAVRRNEARPADQRAGITSPRWASSRCRPRPLHTCSPLINPSPGTDPKIEL